jgi:hypothetical protein
MLWDAAPGSAQWGDVTFSPPKGIGLQDAAHWFSVRSAQVITRSFEIDHGGLIGLDSIHIRSNLSQQATFAFDRGLDRGEVRLDDYILNADALVDFDGAGSIVIGATQNSFESSWSEGVKPPFGGSGVSTGGGDGLNSAGGSASGTDESNVTLIESPVLRITAPMPNANDEGGSIDVTAMVAPRALFAAQHATALATSGIRAGSRASSDVETASQRTRIATADSDELRARAVVYEVSLARDVSEESLEETRAERTPTSTDTPSAPMAPPQGNEPSAAPPIRDANGEIAADVAAPKAADGDAVTLHQTSDLEQHRAEHHAALAATAVRDAALSRFGDDSSDRPATDLETTSSRNQTLGMALAAVVGAGPLLKRMRRARATKIVEQASGLS